MDAQTLTLLIDRARARRTGQGDRARRLQIATLAARLEKLQRQITADAATLASLIDGNTEVTDDARLNSDPDPGDSATGHPAHRAPSLQD
jgi:hypothetical protein